jgi:hypothetical protein
MNNSRSVLPRRRIFLGMEIGPRSVRPYCLLLGMLLTGCFSGCGDRDMVKILLQARTAGKGTSLRLEIQGAVTGPQAGLRYKWLSVSGQCEPQESEAPSTLFKFAEGVKQDRVTVEVWRDGKRIAQNEIAVKFAGEIAELPATEQVSQVQIEITLIPPSEAGGEDTRANISGQVRGKIQPDYRVVIYARAYDSWYMQPTAHDLHPIQGDHTWSSWTHTGEQYAALVVSPGFAPRVRSDMLPSVGDHVLAKVIVEGIKK